VRQATLRHQWRQPTRLSEAGLSNRTLVGVNEGLADAAGAVPLFTSAVSAFLALGLA
jgi:transketolase C-terminal domain/subunit